MIYIYIHIHIYIYVYIYIHTCREEKQCIVQISDYDFPSYDSSARVATCEFVNAVQNAFCKQRNSEVMTFFLPIHNDFEYKSDVQPFHTDAFWAF